MVASVVRADTDGDTDNAPASETIAGMLRRSGIGDARAVVGSGEAHGSMGMLGAFPAHVVWYILRYVSPVFSHRFIPHSLCQPGPLPLTPSPKVGGGTRFCPNATGDEVRFWLTSLRRGGAGGRVAHAWPSLCGTRTMQYRAARLIVPRVSPGFPWL